MNITNLNHIITNNNVSNNSDTLDIDSENANAINFNSLFFKQLKSELKSELNETKNNVLKKEENNNICLLSHEPLDTETCIKLECGHKFNHYPLFKEIFSQKKKYTSFGENRYLKDNELLCPYCRSKQSKLLPFIFTNKIKRVYGVNSPKKWTMMPNKCQYCFKTGKNKGKQCGKGCIKEYCDYHYSIMQSRKTKTKTKTNLNNVNINKNTSKEELSKLTVKTMCNYCKDNKLKRYSRLKKKELVELIIKSFYN